MYAKTNAYIICAVIDQHLRFRYTDSTTPLFLKSEISSFKPPSGTVQAGLRRTWSKTPTTIFFCRHGSIKVFFLLQCPTTRHKQGDLIDNDCDGLVDEELLNLLGLYYFVPQIN